MFDMTKWYLDLVTDLGGAMTCRHPPTSTW